MKTTFKGCELDLSSTNMDVSRVQSGSKCSSDFSIQRILSEESRARQPAGEPPNWLCCTRYQPPRIPRVSSSSCRSRRTGRHARVPFTGAQAAALEAAYARAPYLAPPALRALAAALHLRDDRIKIWFQNRRARERREKCASITPPQAVTLAPTTVQLMPASQLTWPPNSQQPHQSATRDPQDLSHSSILPSKLSINSCNVQHTKEYENVIDFPQDLSHASWSLTPDCSGKKSLSQPEGDMTTDRPETPLDVETVEVD